MAVGLCFQLRSGKITMYRVWFSEVSQYFKCPSCSRISTQFGICHTVDFNVSCTL